MSRRTTQLKDRGQEVSSDGRWSATDAVRALRAWERSGKTMAAFCREQGIQSNRLYWWRKQLGQWADSACGAPPAPGLADGDDVSPGWVEATVCSSSQGAAGAAVAVQLRTGDRVEMATPAGVDAAFLVQLCRGLLESTR